MNNHNRHGWVDMAKVLAIYAVVYSHTIGCMGPKDLAYISFFISPSPLVVFFFVSGFLFRVKTDKFAAFILQSAKSLLVPYLFFNVFSALLLWKLLSPETFKSNFIEFLIGGSFSFSGPSWFLLALFWIRVFAFVLRKVRIAIVYWGLVLLVGSMPYFMNIDVYWAIDSAMMCLPLFALGQLVKEKGIVEKVLAIKTKWRILILLISAICLLLVYRYCAAGLNIARCDYGSYGLLGLPLNALIALLSIGLYLNFNKLKWGGLSSSTIVIMGLHLTYLQCLWAIANKIPNVMHWIVESPFVSITIFAMSYLTALFLQRYTPFLIGNRK